MKITPWEVKGDVDYDKLIKQFGTQKINKLLLERLKKHTGELHFLLRRNIFFSHRDFNWILDKYEKKEKFFLYTGRGPSENVHLGHLLPWILTKWLQDKFKVKLYFQLTDDEKFYFKPNLKLEDTKKWAYENALDVMALGFDKKRTEFILDTQDIKKLYPVAAKIAKKVTFSTAKAVFGFKNENNIGQIFYTALQSAPCFLEKKPCLIPLAIDQDPHFRITRDVAPKLGWYKPSILHCVFLPSLLGPKGKMSASIKEGTIYTTDSAEVVKHKINKYAYSGGRATLKEHREKGGNPDIDVSFQYLRMFFEPDDKKLADIYYKYKNGSMLTGELKSILIDKINKFLKKHQANRLKAKKFVDKFIKV